MGISIGKRPDFEYHGGKWLKYDRYGFNSSHPSLGSPLNLGEPWRPLATIGDHWRHAWKWSFWPFFRQTWLNNLAWGFIWDFDRQDKKEAQQSSALRRKATKSEFWANTCSKSLEMGSKDWKRRLDFLEPWCWRSPRLDSWVPDALSKGSARWKQLYSGILH